MLEHRVVLDGETRKVHPLIRSNSQVAKPVHCALVFDSSDPRVGVAYGFSCARAVLTALLKADPDGLISSRLLQGDVLLSSICERMSKVETLPRKGSVQATWSVDRDLFSTLLWDLTEAIAVQWNTCDAERFPLVLGRHAACCVTIPTVSEEFLAPIDGALRGAPGYIGALTVDPGNPVQFELFCNLLVDQMYLQARRLYLLGEPGGEELSIDGWVDLGLDGVEVVEHNSYSDSGPIRPDRSRLSPRGEITRRILDRRGRPTYREKVGHELFYRPRAAVDFDLTTSSPNHAPLDVIIPEEKLVGYSLNENHPNPTAAGKAKLFRELLAIEASDWRFLAAQLDTGLRKRLPRNVRPESFPDGQWGIKFSTDIPVVGRNGNHRDVTTGWIVRSGEATRLTTAYIAKRKNQTGAAGETPPVLPTNISGDERWAMLEALARAAGDEAATQVVPTPMTIVAGWPGLPRTATVEQEGMCGGAFVTVKDGRRGFAGWLRRSRLGHAGKGAAQEIPSPVRGQSMERARAFADSFASVLRANGVDCSVTSYLT